MGTCSDGKGNGMVGNGGRSEDRGVGGGGRWVEEWVKGEKGEERDGRG